GEDPQDEKPPRFRRHRPDVEDRDETEDVPGARLKRYRHVAVDAALRQKRSPGEALQHACRKMREVARQDCGGWAGGEVEVLTFPYVVALPDGEDTAVRRGLKFANGGVRDSDRLGQVTHKRPEELLASAAGGPFDHRAEGVQVVRYHAGRRLRRAGRCL